MGCDHSKPSGERFKHIPLTSVCLWLGVVSAVARSYCPDAPLYTNFAPQHRAPISIADAAAYYRISLPPCGGGTGRGVSATWKVVHHPHPFPPPSRGREKVRIPRLVTTLAGVVADAGQSLIPAEHGHDGSGRQRPLFTSPMGRGRLDARKRDSRVRGWSGQVSLLTFERGTPHPEAHWHSLPTSPPGRGE